MTFIRGMITNLFLRRRSTKTRHLEPPPWQGRKKNPMHFYGLVLYVERINSDGRGSGTVDIELINANHFFAQPPVSLKVASNVMMTILSPPSNPARSGKGLPSLPSLLKEKTVEVSPISFPPIHSLLLPPHSHGTLPTSPPSPSCPTSPCPRPSPPPL